MRRSEATDGLRDNERQGVLWAIDLALQHDDGFAFPRDQNREILRSAREKIANPFLMLAPETEDFDA